jgi:hypothetical protein
MNLEFAKFLDKARDSATEVSRVVSSHKYPGDRRTLLVTGLLAAMTQYHRSALQLTKSGAVASSYALTRAIVRDMRYGLWIISCATNEQILQIEKDNEFPLSISEMTREIEAAYRADPFFQNLKDRWGARLNRYSLTGVVQLGRWDGDASSGLHFDDEEIRDVVTIATLCIVVLAAKFLAGQKYPADSEQIEALAGGYSSSTS